MILLTKLGFEVAHAPFNLEVYATSTSQMNFGHYIDKPMSSDFNVHTYLAGCVCVHLVSWASNNKKDLYTKTVKYKAMSSVVKVVRTCCYP